jgi:hypothetical protein
MKKTLLTNPAFRYIFEVFIIIFSVTISFYIQDVLNEKDRIEIKNKALSGVLKDISGDRFSLNEGLDINKKRRESINYLIDKRIDNNTISSIRRYKSFLGNNSNYETLQSTGAIESIGFIFRYKPKSKSVKNSQKRPKTAKNDQKWSKLIKNGQKLTKICVF